MDVTTASSGATSHASANQPLRPIRASLAAMIVSSVSKVYGEAPIWRPRRDLFSIRVSSLAQIVSAVRLEGGGRQTRDLGVAFLSISSLPTEHLATMHT